MQYTVFDNPQQRPWKLTVISFPPYTFHFSSFSAIIVPIIIVIVIIVVIVVIIVKKSEYWILVIFLSLISFTWPLNLSIISWSSLLHCITGCVWKTSILFFKSFIENAQPGTVIHPGQPQVQVANYPSPGYGQGPAPYWRILESHEVHPM